MPTASERLKATKITLKDCILSRNESGRAVKGLDFELMSSTLQLNGFVLDCSSSTPWLHFAIASWFASGQLKFLNSMFTCTVY